MLTAKKVKSMREKWKLLKLLLFLSYGCFIQDQIMMETHF